MTTRPSRRRRGGGVPRTTRTTRIRAQLGTAARRAAAAVRAVRARLARLGRWAARRCRPWRPVVIVDARPARARRLRRRLGRATAAHFAGLGLPPPAHLLIVVQRTVPASGEDPVPADPVPADPLRAGAAAGPRAGLLEVFEDATGRRRHVLLLAFRVGEERVGEGALVATLRAQLQHLAADALGPRLSVAAATAPVATAAGVTDVGTPDSRTPAAGDTAAEVPPDDGWAWPDLGPTAEDRLGIEPVTVTADAAEAGVR